MKPIYYIFFSLIINALNCHAVLTFKNGQKYRFHCTMQSTINDYVQPGTYINVNSPIGHGPIGDNENTIYWYITQIKEKIYTIQNAATNEYITYDGIYQDTPVKKRYIGLTSEPQGQDSEWFISLSNDNEFIITSVAHPDHRFNVRKSAGYVLGTYQSQGAPSDNELFAFYDENGNPVTDKDSHTDIDYLYGTTSDGYYWESTALPVPIVTSEDNSSDPVLYAIQNTRSGKYLSIQNGQLMQTDNIQSQFYFAQKDEGVQIFSEDGAFLLSALVPTEDLNQPVSFIDKIVSQDENTWNLSYFNHTDFPGYTLSVSKCSANEENYTEHPYYWNGYTYLNDYKNEFIGFYLANDPGNQYIFYSKDERHKQHLEENGLIMPLPGEKPIVPMESVLQELTFDKKPAVYDALYNTLMLPLRSNYRGGNKDFESIIAYLTKGSKPYTLYIDGTPVSSGSSYCFKNVSGNQRYQIEFHDEDGTCISKSYLSFTYLPIVEITGNSFSSGYYQPGTIRVNDPNNNGTDSLYYATFRYRGATASGLRKKAYAVKLTDANGMPIDRRFLSMREDNNWILDAMAIDAGRMRNRVSTDLWNDFSTPPYHKDFEPKAINGTRGQFVEVLLNGSYAGIYCLTEKIDRKQLKLKKIKPGRTDIQRDTIRGVLYKSTSWSYSVFMGHNPDQSNYPGTNPTSYNNQNSNWDSWEIKYPDLDDGEDIDWKPLFDAICTVATGNASTFKNRVEDYFDLPVWRDYYLFLELLLATDNHGKNMYIYNYNIQESNKTSLTPWDLDGTWGRRWNGSSSITSNAAQDFETFIKTYEHGEHTLFYKLRTTNYQNWNQQLAQRYAELRSTFFDEKSLQERFVNYHTLFKESGAEDREISRWNNSDGIKLDFDNEISYIYRWIHNRLIALDRKYDYDPTSVINTYTTINHLSVIGGKGQLSINTDTEQSIIIYDLNGIAIRQLHLSIGQNTIEGLAPGIYIVNRHKVIVQ